MQSQCARGRVSARPPLWERKPLSGRALSPAGERLLPRQDRPRPPIVIETGPDGISLGRKATKPGGVRQRLWWGRSLAPGSRSALRPRGAELQSPVSNPLGLRASHSCLCFVFGTQFLIFSFAQIAYTLTGLFYCNASPGVDRRQEGRGEVEVRADGGGPGPAPGHVLRKGTLSIAPWRCLLRGTGRGRGRCG